MRPLNLLNDGGLQGANSIVFKCGVRYVTRSADSSHRQVEWEGPEVVLKGLVTPIEIPHGESSFRIHAELLGRQAADHVVLVNMPSHDNIVEVVHHFEAPAMLLRPFVAPAHLPFLCLSKTT